jgi:periplasmic divalent cation tolerance protein
MDEDTVTILFCTAPDADTGQRIASKLVEYGLAACVNLLPGITSVYRWQGQVQTDAEVLLMIKACAADYKRIETTICAEHPYELPEIIAVPVSGGLAEYLDWVRNNRHEAP